MPTKSHTLAVEEPRLAAQQAFALIAPELAAVEAEFERQANSNVQVVAEIGKYIYQSGGKRVRPALLLLSTYAAGGDAAAYNAIRMATVMEFLHTATLVHDDIIDNAEMRRGTASVNARYGNQVTVLMGDWLYMSAFETSLAERSLEVLDILTVVTRKMIEGELIQLTAVGSTEILEATYFEILKRKTAYLFSACCEIGAMLAVKNKTAREQQALRDYGMNLGIAFQLTDDLLDFTQNEEDIGKPAGADLLEGKVTLPLIYLLETEPHWRTALRGIMSDGVYNAVSRDELVAAAERSGATKRARVQAAHAAHAAHAALNVLPVSEYREALAMIPGYLINRES